MKIAWLGSGKISKAFFTPLKTLMGFEVFVYSRSFETLKSLETYYPIIACETIEACVCDADMIVLAVKPNVIESVLADLKPYLKESTLIVSLAAGISLHQLYQFSNHSNIIRLMPSTAVSIQKSIMAICYDEVSITNLDRLNQFFAHFGQLIKIEETLMNAFIASSGSGIAYVYAMMDAMMVESKRLGFSEEHARDIILKTFEAAVLMAMNHPLTLEALMQQVASKGGTTEAGLLELRDPLQKVIYDTFEATLLKAKDLSK